MGDLFDAAAMYDEDYLYFFAAPVGLSEFAVRGPVVPGADVPGEAAAELAWLLLDLRPRMSVLDLACGHGELATRLAARGCRVTGLDSSAVFLDRARADAGAVSDQRVVTSDRIRGVIPIMNTPFTDSGAVDFDSLASEVAFINRCGARAFVWGQLDPFLNE